MSINIIIGADYQLQKWCLPSNAGSCCDDPPGAVNESSAEVAIIFVGDGNNVWEISGFRRISPKDALVFVQSWQSFTQNIKNLNLGFNLWYMKHCIIGVKLIIPVTEQTTATRRRTDFMLVLVECKQRS
jgi:hypothetical protein